MRLILEEKDLGGLINMVIVKNDDIVTALRAFRKEVERNRIHSTLCFRDTYIRAGERARQKHRLYLIRERKRQLKIARYGFINGRW
jgi:ribosomal protein S21